MKSIFTLFVPKYTILLSVPLFL